MCGKPCECIGYKTPIPPRTKIKEWGALRDWFFGLKRSTILRRQVTRVRRKHYLEREIARVGALEPNEGRRSAIEQLREQLNALEP